MWREGVRIQYLLPEEKHEERWTMSVFALLTDLSPLVEPSRRSAHHTQIEAREQSVKHGSWLKWQCFVTVKATIPDLLLRYSNGADGTTGACTVFIHPTACDICACINNFLQSLSFTHIWSFFILWSKDQSFIWNRNLFFSQQSSVFSFDLEVLYQIFWMCF